MIQITKTITDSDGKKFIKRITKRKDSKELKPEDIIFEAFPQTLSKDIKSFEQIEVVPEKEFDETVIKKMEEFRQMNQGQGRTNGGFRIGG